MEKKSDRKSCTKSGDQCGGGIHDRQDLGDHVFPPYGSPDLYAGLPIGISPEPARLPVSGQLKAIQQKQTHICMCIYCILRIYLCSKQSTRKVHAEAHVSQIVGQVFDSMFGTSFDQKCSAQLFGARKCNETYKLRAQKLYTVWY